MAEKLQFELVSPERLLLSEAVEMVLVPGTEGYFGVLKGHAPLISTVRPGVIDVYEGNEVTERIFVSGGFAEVTPERCTVLADQAMPLSALDRADIEAALRALDGEIASARDHAGRETGEAREDAVAALRALEARRAIERAKLDALG